LQYLSFTNPDIALSVNGVCQFMYQPLLSHWQAVKRIIHYLKSNISYGLLFTWHSSCNTPKVKQDYELVDGVLGTSNV
jgi:hypothetical protein